MEFEESQFQGATSGGDGFDGFAAADPTTAEAPAPVAVENGGGLDDFFSGSAPVASPSSAVPAVADAPIADYADADAPPADSLAGDAPAAEPVNDEDPFFQHYAPTPAPAPAAAPEAVDPRVDWRKQNSEVLKKKDVEESTVKQQQKETATKFLSKFYEVRTTTLTTRKANNRKSEAHQKEVSLPAGGTPWEKINALVNLNAGIHQKDVARYKAVLITCKAKNVAIRA